jgi:hypothetical protein
MWNDDSETSSMTNADDTASTTSDSPVIFHVSINFTQLIESSINTTD